MEQSRPHGNVKGKETTVSLRDLAPCGTELPPDDQLLTISEAENLPFMDPTPLETSSDDVLVTSRSDSERPLSDIPVQSVPLRRSDRVRKPVDRLDL